MFNPAYDKDKFESTAWTLDGVVGPLKLVYTGGYLDRQVNQSADDTNYARRLCGLLPVLRTRVGRRCESAVQMFLAECDLA